LPGTVVSGGLQEANMADRRTRHAWWLGLAVLLLGCGATEASGATRIEAGGSAQEAPPPEVGQPPDAGDEAGVEATAGSTAGSLQAVKGTDREVPVPDPAIGTEVVDLAIPLADADAMVHGVAFYREGPMSGSVVGGVSIVFDRSPAVRGPDGGPADPGAVAEYANPGVEPEVTDIGGRPVLGWPDSEVVPADGIPQSPRPVSRYVVLLDDGIAMVTFDDVAADLASDYLDQLVGAL
jgi:hypothetical protein